VPPPSVSVSSVLSPSGSRQAVTDVSADLDRLSPSGIGKPARGDSSVISPPQGPGQQEGPAVSPLLPLSGPLDNVVMSAKEAEPALLPPAMMTGGAAVMDNALEKVKMTEDDAEWNIDSIDLESFICSFLPSVGFAPLPLPSSASVVVGSPFIVSGVGLKNSSSAGASSATAERPEPTMRPFPFMQPMDVVTPTSDVSAIELSMSPLGAIASPPVAMEGDAPAEAAQLQGIPVSSSLSGAAAADDVEPSRKDWPAQDQAPLPCPARERE